MTAPVPWSEADTHAVRQVLATTRRSALELLAGNERSALLGSGLEFREVREYQPGDDLRALDGNVTARLGRPHVKCFQAERERVLWLLVDVSPSMRAAPAAVRQRREEAVATLAMAAALSGDRVGLVTFAQDVEDWVEARSGPAAVLRALMAWRHSASACSARQSDLDPAGRWLLKAPRRGALVLALSDWHCQYSTDLLSAVARRHDVLAARVDDDVTDRLPRALVPLRDLESGVQRWVDGTRVGQRETWRQRADQWRTETVATWRRCGAVPLALNADRPLVGSLREALLESQARRSAQR